MPPLKLSNSCAVLYALNDNPIYLRFAFISIGTVRKFNPTIPIRVVVFGKSKKVRQKLSVFSYCEVITRPALTQKRRHFLKWHALSYVSNFNRVIFLDADTLCFKNLSPFLKKYSVSSLYARAENGCQNRLPFKIGKFTVDCIIDFEDLKVCQKALGARRVNIFNSGIMLFNKKSHLKVISALKNFDSIANKFEKQKMVYPCRVPHILEEIVASLVIGKLSKFSVSELNPKDSPYYVEWHAQREKQTGSIMHTWSKFFVQATKNLNIGI